jgi:putative ABC transport system substrate-binding protein
MRRERADALLVLEEPVPGVYAKEIAELAAKNRLPTMFAPSRAASGGLIFYGTSQTEAIGHMAAYVDKILKGAKPGELPVETVTRYELIVNLKTAQEIGVAIPPGLLGRADRAIE